MKTTSLQKAFLLLMMLCGWFALIVQLYLMIEKSKLPAVENVIRFFSFFTIDSNLIVTLCATFLLFRPNVRLTSFFDKQPTQTAIAVYIFVVGLIYNAVLRFIWAPEGLQRVVDEMLHLVNPLLFILYWGIFSTHLKLKWTSFLPWLIYPLLYTAFIFARAQWSHFYPYPFLDVDKIGGKATLFNCLFVTAVFVITSLAFIGIGNLIAGRKK